VLIEGEAGIGKTTLLQEFAEQHAGEFKVAWGWCEALFTPRPLGPLHDMGRSMGAGIAALLEQSAPPDRLFPALLNKLQDDGDPLILIFEDVHWADNATLDLVKYLGRRIGLLRAMVVLTARSDEIGPTHPLSYVLGDLPAAAVTRIKLGPLSPAAVHELAVEAGQSGDELYRVTAGNPFFVTELLATGGSEAGSVPDSIRDAVWSRLARLTPGERDVLEMMSIVPGNMELGLIKALLGADAEDLVDMAVGRGLLRRDPQGDISFRHELARRATLDRLSSSLQRSLHSKVEAALAALPGQDSMLHLARRVHHAAGAEDGAGVLALAPRAAAQASRLGAHQQAASFLQTALEYADIAEPAVAAQLHESWAYEASLGLFDYNAIIASHHRAIAIWRELGNAPRSVSTTASCRACTGDAVKGRRRATSPTSRWKKSRAPDPGRNWRWPTARARSSICCTIGLQKRSTGGAGPFASPTNSALSRRGCTRSTMSALPCCSIPGPAGAR
jgi:predicted ATPase